MISFELDIEPMPAPRPRATRHGHIYVEPAYLQYRKDIAYMARQHNPGILTTEAIKLDLTFFRNKEITSSRFGDIDNLVKGVLDALKGVIYVDDAQVHSISAHKIKREKPGIWVVVYYEGILAEN